VPDLPANWRKAAASGEGDNCVEVAGLPAVVAVRDSKNRGGGHLEFTRGTWSQFTERVSRGSYDLPT
jgi:Domain of unknown function (DUF397)